MVIHGKDSSVGESDGVEGRVHVWKVHFPDRTPPQTVPANSQKQQSQRNISHLKPNGIRGMMELQCPQSPPEL